MKNSVAFSYTYSLQWSQRDQPHLSLTLKGRYIESLKMCMSMGKARIFVQYLEGIGISVDTSSKSRSKVISILILTLL